VGVLEDREVVEWIGLQLAVMVIPVDRVVVLVLVRPFILEVLKHQLKDMRVVVD
tara:strand:+ start:215 stop:376 length:162 start_codon:yes stop_codon:yes gene_type:complete